MSGPLHRGCMPRIWLIRSRCDTVSQRGRVHREGEIRVRVHVIVLYWWDRRGCGCVGSLPAWGGLRTVEAIRGNLVDAGGV